MHETLCAEEVDTVLSMYVCNAFMRVHFVARQPCEL